MLDMTEKLCSVKERLVQTYNFSLAVEKVDEKINQSHRFTLKISKDQNRKTQKRAPLAWDCNQPSSN